jgi:hypothetical protein
MWDYLESVQPYHAGCEWLGQSNQVNNENKHGSLVEQTRVEVEQVRATMPGGGSVAWNPASVKFGQGVYIGGVPVDPKTQMPDPSTSLKVERIMWVDFQFEGVQVSALALANAAVAGTWKIVAEVERQL